MLNKRIYPRISTTLPVVISNEDGVSCNVITLNTSIDGLCIQCKTAERNLMTPGGSFIRNGRPVELFVGLDLSENVRISARCHVTFSRRIAKDVCHIGMRYMDIENEGYEKLIQFIKTSVSSNEDGPLNLHETGKQD
jgi:PilZ domain-containing protein